MIQKIRLSVGMSVMFIALLAASAGASIAGRDVAEAFRKVLRKGIAN